MMRIADRPVSAAPGVWKALAHPLRRRMLDRLAFRPRSTGELAGAFPGRTRFAVMQHLRVLRRAGLVAVRVEGRRRINHFNPVPLRRVYDRWIARHAHAAAGTALALERAVQEQGDAT